MPLRFSTAGALQETYREVDEGETLSVIAGAISGAAKYGHCHTGNCYMYLLKTNSLEEVSVLLMKAVYTYENYAKIYEGGE